MGKPRWKGEKKKAYLGLCAVLNQLPNELLTVLQGAPEDSLRMRSDIQRLATIRGNLHEAMVRRRFSCKLVWERIAINHGRGELAGMPEAILKIRQDSTKSKEPLRKIWRN